MCVLVGQASQEFGIFFTSETCKFQNLQPRLCQIIEKLSFTNHPLTLLFGMRSISLLAHDSYQFLYLDQ